MKSTYRIFLRAQALFAKVPREHQNLSISEHAMTSNSFALPKRMSADISPELMLEQAKIKHPFTTSRLKLEQAKVKQTFTTSRYVLLFPSLQVTKRVIPAESVRLSQSSPLITQTANDNIQCFLLKSQRWHEHEEALNNEF